MAILAAFIVPHPPLIVSQVGNGREKQVQKTIDSYISAAKQIAALKPDTIIISSPHATMYSDYFHISRGDGAKGSFADFGAAQVCFDEQYDTRLAMLTAQLAADEGFPAGLTERGSGELDHGTMVPLYFIRQQYSDFRLLRVGLSWLPLREHFRFGQIIRRAVDTLGRRVVYVASGDLSHKLQTYGPYGFAPQGPEYDRQLIDVCSRGALDELLEFDEDMCEQAAECGHRSFVIMSGVLDGDKVKATVYSHEDVTGVGYGVCSFYPTGQDPYVALARKTVEQYVKSGTKPGVTDDIPQEMKAARGGAFVSIHKQGQLRGCIGTIAATQPSLAEEIISNAVSAAVCDPRFDPITPDELEALEINVDVLGEPELIDSPSKLDVKRYGVIVSCGMRRGLLLPDLEGVDSVQQQIAIAMAKGGITQGENITLHRFEVVRHR